jgi:DNA-binding NarL/FixJ family response regulator
METINRILVYGRPGHYLQSLAAVLQTLPRSELFLVNSLEHGDWDRSPQTDLMLVISDPESVIKNDVKRMELLKIRYPELRCIALVDNPQQSRAAKVLGVDVVLSRGASAGELISTIQQLIGSSGRALHLSSMYSISAAI